MELTEINRQNLSSMVLVTCFLVLPMSSVMMGTAVYIAVVVDSELKLLQDEATDSLAILMGVTGAVNFLVALLLMFVMARSRQLSCRQDWMGMLLLGTGLALGSSLLVLITSIFALVQLALLSEAYGQGLTRAMNEYSKNAEIKERVDIMQIDYSCCGDLGYYDWFKVPWVSSDPVLETYLIKNRARVEEGAKYDDVPFSCCDPKSPRPCIHHHVSIDHVHFNYNHHIATTLYTTGCRPILIKFFGHSVLRTSGVCLLLMAIMQLAAVTASRFVHTSFVTALSTGNPEATAICYLLQPPAEPGAEGKQDLPADAEEGETSDETSELDSELDESAAPTPTESPAPTPAESPAPTPTESTAPTPTESLEPSPTESPAPSPTESLESSPTERTAPTPTESLEPTPTESTAPTPIESLEPSPTESPAPSPTDSLEPSPTESTAPSPTESLEPSPTESTAPSPTESLETSLSASQPESEPASQPDSQSMTATGTDTESETVSDVPQIHENVSASHASYDMLPPLQCRGFGPDHKRWPRAGDAHNNSSEFDMGQNQRFRSAYGTSPLHSVTTTRRRSGQESQQHGHREVRTAPGPRPLARHRNSLTSHGVSVQLPPHLGTSFLIPPPPPPPPLSSSPQPRQHSRRPGLKGSRFT